MRVSDEPKKLENELLELRPRALFALRALRHS